jgi:ribosome-binding factor A
MDPDVEFHICCNKLREFKEFVGSKIMLRNSRLKRTLFAQLCHLLNRVSRIYSTTESHQTSFIVLLDSMQHKISSILSESFNEFKNCEELLFVEDEEEENAKESDKAITIEFLEVDQEDVENSVEQEPPENHVAEEAFRTTSLAILSHRFSHFKNVNAFTRVAKVKQKLCSHSFKIKFWPSIKFRKSSVLESMKQRKGDSEVSTSPLEEKPPDEALKGWSAAYRIHKLNRRPPSRFHSSYKRGKKKARLKCGIYRTRLPPRRAQKHLTIKDSLCFTSGYPVPEDHKMFRKKNEDPNHRRVSLNVHKQQGRERIIEGIDPGPASLLNCY